MNPWLKTNWKAQATLALVLVLLAGFAYWLEYNHLPQKEEAEESSKKLFSLEDQAIKSIALVDGAKTTTLECMDLDKNLCKTADQSQWKLTSPVNVKADSTNVNSLVSSLGNITARDSISMSEETEEQKKTLLKEYELDEQNRSGPNAKRIEVTTKDGKKQIAYFGGMHPIGNNYFTLISRSGDLKTQQILLTPQYFQKNISNTVSHWRDKKLFTINAHEVASFSMITPKQKQKLYATKKDSKWYLSRSPQGTDVIPGDIETITNLLTAVTYLSAKDFSAEKKDSAEGKKALAGTRVVAEYSLTPDTEKDKPAETVTLKLYEKHGPKINEWYATLSNSDPVYKMEDSIKNRIDKDLTDLRLAKLITSLERFAAKKMKFSGKILNSRSLILVNKGENWEYDAESDQKGKPDTEAVQKFLDRMTGKRIKDFLGSKLPAGQENSVTFTLYGDESKVLAQLSFWKNKGVVYAKDLLSPKMEGFRLDKGIEDVLPWSLSHFNDAPNRPAAPAVTPAPGTQGEKK